MGISRWILKGERYELRAIILVDIHSLRYCCDDVAKTYLTVVYFGEFEQLLAVLPLLA